jgi:hypothetical protein
VVHLASSSADLRVGRTRIRHSKPALLETALIGGAPMSEGSSMLKYEKEFTQIPDVNPDCFASARLPPMPSNLPPGTSLVQQPTLSVGLVSSIGQFCAAS